MSAENAFCNQMGYKVDMVRMQRAQKVLGWSFHSWSFLQLSFLQPLSVWGHPNEKVKVSVKLLFRFVQTKH